MPKDDVKDFTPLGGLGFIYQPSIEASHRQVGSSSPSLIVLCSWMGAAGRYIVKYTQGYQQAYPHATIVLVRAGISDVFGGEATQRSGLKTAAEVILRLTSDETRGPTLLHACSNGGSIMAIRLATMLRQRQNNPARFDKIIFDCTPGGLDFKGGARAITAGLPQRFFVRSIAQILVRFVGMFLMLFVFIFRREDMVTKLRRLLNDPTLFPSTVPRLYMYSRQDQMVGYTAVHSHAEDSRKMGYQSVEEVVFTKAPHCALPTEDSARYWNSIQAHVSGESMKHSDKSGST